MMCLPGHFRSPEVTWCHFLSHDCLLWASLVGSQTHTICRFATFYSHFQVTSAEMTSLPSLPFTWGHVTWFSVMWLPPPASYSLVGSQTHSILQFSAFYSHFQVISGELMPPPGRFWSPGHVTSFPVTWLPPSASYSLVRSQTHIIRQFSAFYSHFQVTSGQMSLSVTSGQLSSRDIISCHVTASSCQLQPCMKSNAQCTPVFGLLQPLPGDFRSNDVTSTHFRPPEFTWRHFLSRDCVLRATALYEVKRWVYASFRPSTATSRWLPIKWHHFRVTSDHLRSRDVISCNVTASSCELQPCKKSNAQCTTVCGLLQPLPGDFWSNDVTSGHFRSNEFVTWFPVTGLPPPVSYSLGWSLKLSIREFQAFYTTSRWLPVKWFNFRVTSAHLR